MSESDGDGKPVLSSLHQILLEKRHAGFRAPLGSPELAVIDGEAMVERR